MKIKTLWCAIGITLGTALAVLSAHAQTFQNLDFEQANPISAGVPAQPWFVTAASALPYWTVYFGTSQQTEVVQNLYATGQVSVDIFGPNYPAAGPGNPGTIDGNYSVMLQAGGNGDPSNPELLNASIEQYGTVPIGSQSLQFEAWDWSPSTSILAVSFNGNSLSPVVIETGPNYTLYGADLSAFAGQTGELEFTSVFNYAGPSWIELDDISFSTVALTPEPGIVALTAIGALLFGARKRFARR